VEPAFAAQVEYWDARLDQSDYFELLKLSQAAVPGEIKKAYHRESRAFHPDRFFKLEDADFRDAVDRIYKRINEAYVVLRDDKKRARYAADMAGPSRAQKLRFNEESEQEAKAAAKKEKEEEIGKTPNGRKFYAEGMKAMEAGKFAEAHRAFKTAFMYESSNAKFKEKMQEAEKNLPKNDFRIK
jgi:curved DNA-binding protein CbpA